MDAITNIRALLKDGITEVKVFISHHPMETGLALDSETGVAIPANFIQEVICQHNDKRVLSAMWGAGISADPYLVFRFKGGQRGDKITFQWQDKKGQTAFVETFIEEV